MIKCNIPCDYCGKRPANWFGSSSVAICSNPNCINQCDKSYEQHCEDVRLESEIEKEYYGW